MTRIRDERNDGSQLETAPAPERPGDLPLHEAFDLLENPRRRHLLRELSGTDGPIDAGRLATRVADREPGPVTPAVERRVTVSLHQLHLPRLADAGVIGYDRDERTVTPTSQVTRLRAVVRAAAATFDSPGGSRSR
jgi:hypothetical protein